MKSLVINLVLISVLFKYNGAEACKIDEIGENGKWKKFELPPINDTHGEAVLAEFNTTGIIGLSVTKPDKYLDATWENDVFKISTTEYFKNYEKDLIGQKDKYKGKLSLECSFKCSKTERGKDKDKGHKLEVYQQVIDINNHYPTFSKEVYEYNFTVGIPKNYDLTVFESISAYDYDFSNNMIYFTIENAAAKKYFNITYSGKRQDKYSNYYTTRLTTLENVMAPYTQELIIMATDVGQPTRLNTTAKVIVTVNTMEQESHPPVFSKHVYFAQYTEKNELKLEENMLIAFGSKAKISITQSSYQEYFEISQDSSAEDKINVKKLKDLPIEIIQKQFIIIDIKAKSEDAERPGQTSLIIYFTHANNGENNEGSNGIKPPAFGDYLYFAKYSPDGGLAMNKTITVKYEAPAKITIKSEGYEEYFQVSQNGTTKEQIDVKVIKPLTDEILENHFIIVYIQAKTEGVVSLGRTALMIYLQSNKEEIDVHPPVFSKHIYIGNYTSNQLQMKEPIKVRYGATANMIIRTKGYEEYFTVSQNPQVIEQIDVKVKKPLSDSTYQDDFIIIEIEAENEGLTIPGRTALLIRLNYPSQSLQVCDGVLAPGFFGGEYVFPLILFFASIIIIVFLNIVVVSFYLKSQKMKALNNA